MIHQTKISPRYAETDQMGIIHHAVYPIWYEVARTEFLHAIDIDYAELERHGLRAPLIELNVQYKGVTRYDQPLVVETRINKLSASRIWFYYEVFVEGQDKPVNNGCTVHAWTNLLKPINMKKHYPEAYQKLFAAIDPIVSKRSLPV